MAKLYDVHIQNILQESSHIQSMYLLESLQAINKATPELLSEITRKKELIDSVVMDAEEDVKTLFLEHCTYTAPKLYLKKIKGLIKLMENSIEELETNLETVLTLLNKTTTP